MGCINSFFARHAGQSTANSPATPIDVEGKQEEIFAVVSTDPKGCNGESEGKPPEQPESNDTSYGVEATAVRALAASTGTVAILGTTAKTKFNDDGNETSESVSPSALLQEEPSTETPAGPNETGHVPLEQELVTNEAILTENELMNAMPSEESVEIESEIENTVQEKEGIPANEVVEEEQTEESVVLEENIKIDESSSDAAENEMVNGILNDEEKNIPAVGEVEHSDEVLNLNNEQEDQLTDVDNPSVGDEFQPSSLDDEELDPKLDHSVNNDTNNKLDNLNIITAANMLDVRLEDDTDKRILIIENEIERGPNIDETEAEDNDGAVPVDVKDNTQQDEENAIVKTFTSETVPNEDKESITQSPEDFEASKSISSEQLQTNSISETSISDFTNVETDEKSKADLGNPETVQEAGSEIITVDVSEHVLENDLAKLDENAELNEPSSKEEEVKMSELKEEEEISLAEDGYEAGETTVADPVTNSDTNPSESLDSSREVVKSAHYAVLEAEQSLLQCTEVPQQVQQFAVDSLKESVVPESQDQNHSKDGILFGELVEVDRVEEAQEDEGISYSEGALDGREEADLAVEARDDEELAELQTDHYCQHLQPMHYAATKIQSNFRGYLQRKRNKTDVANKKILEEKDKIIENEKEDVFGEVEEVKEEIRRDDGEREESEDEREEWVPVAVIRNSGEFHDIVPVLPEQLVQTIEVKSSLGSESAATKIQATFRGHMARKEMKKIREEQNTEIDSGETAEEAAAQEPSLEESAEFQDQRALGEPLVSETPDPTQDNIISAASIDVEIPAEPEVVDLVEVVVEAEEAESSDGPAESTISEEPDTAVHSADRVSGAHQTENVREAPTKGDETAVEPQTDSWGPPEKLDAAQDNGYKLEVLEAEIIHDNTEKFSISASKESEVDLELTAESSDVSLPEKIIEDEPSDFEVTSLEENSRSGKDPMDEALGGPSKPSESTQLEATPSTPEPDPSENKESPEKEDPEEDKESPEKEDPEEDKESTEKEDPEEENPQEKNLQEEIQNETN